MLNLIHNPTHDEFMEWVKAAERETWRHIPRIKSHCAEERTLDRCVQRLRKKIMMESWDKHSSTNILVPKEGEDGGLNARTPSFFQSPSLVCLGGLNVLDPFETVNSVNEGKKEAPYHNVKESDPLDVTVRSSHVDSTLGWGGLGLHGNHSYTNLHRSTSGGSGIFILDEEENEKSPADANLGTKTGSGSWANQVGGGYAQEDYIKTSTMANFYYGRKAHSHGNFAEGDADEETKSGRPRSASQLNESPRESPLRASIR